MESQAAVLQKLLDRLCQETDQGQIYQTLMQMSTVPILCDRLADIGFRETIKRLKQEQLLVQFVKDLVAKWLPQAPQDFGMEKSHTTQQQSNSPEDNPQDPASQEARGAGRELFLQLSHCGPGKISRLNPSQTSHVRSDPWTPHSRSQGPGVNWSPEQQLAGRKEVQERPPWASLKEPWQREGARPLSRKPGAGTGEHKWLVFGGSRKSQPPGHWEQEEAPGAGSLQTCLQAEDCPSSYSSLVPPPCKRKRELPCQAEVQRRPAKVPRGEWRSSKHLSPMDACSIPETHSSGQACLPRDVVLESASPQQDQEGAACGWSLRKNHKTQVYSGRRPAALLQEKSHLGLLAEEPPGTWDVAHCQAGKDIAASVQPEEKSRPQTQTCKQTHSRPESATHLQLQDSQEERLQRLRARIQNTRDKRLQATQTKMISFHTQHKSPDQHGQPGPRGAAYARNSHSLPEPSAHPRSQKAPHMPSVQRGCKKAPAKRPAPLMAKALKDYSHYISKK